MCRAQVPALRNQMLHVHRDMASNRFLMRPEASATLDPISHCGKRMVDITAFCRINSFWYYDNDGVVSTGPIGPALRSLRWCFAHHSGFFKRFPDMGAMARAALA